MNLESLPWSKIHDFLRDVGCSRDRGEFNRRVFEGLQRLIPYDIAAGFFEAGTATLLDGVGLPESAQRAYNGYYRARQPWMNPQGIAEFAASWRINWRNYGSSEYVSDFARPNGLMYAMAANPIAQRTVTLSLHRSRYVSEFSDHEHDILGAVNPHLVNFHRLYNRIWNAESRAPISAEEIADRLPKLSRRESEILALWLNGFTASEVATKLFISERTVESHVQSIYAKLNVHGRREAIKEALRRVRCHS